MWDIPARWNYQRTYKNMCVINLFVTFGVLNSRTIIMISWLELILERWSCFKGAGQWKIDIFSDKKISKKSLKIEYVKISKE